jgi:hypothetical protein
VPCVRGLDYKASLARVMGGGLAGVIHVTQKKKICGVPTCNRPVQWSGVCGAHYRRWRNHRDLRADVPIRPFRPLGDPLATLKKVEAPSLKPGASFEETEHDSATSATA